jgi:cell division protein FtsQ
MMLARKINNDKLLDVSIDQIYVKQDQSFELIPKVGRYVISFGDISDMDDKLIKLKAFLAQGAAVNGWDKYASVDLRFVDQVVCKKK